MPIYNHPPHRCTILGPPTATTDSSGGEVIAWPTTRQAAVPCIINTASASEQMLFAQQGIAVSHTISILSASLTSAVARGDKVTADDSGASYHIEGIRAGRAMGGVPAFTYLQVREML